MTTKAAVIAALCVLSSATGRAAAHDEPEATGPAAEALADLEAWDIDGAAKIAKHLKKTAPDDPVTHFVAGRVAFEQGDYDTAVTELDAALGPGALHNEDYRVTLGAQVEAQATVVEESAHFAVRYKPGKDAALVPYALDSLEAAFSAITSDLDWRPDGKVRIEFYSSPKALARTSSLSEKAVRTTGTIALCKYNRLLVTSPRALVRGYEWQDTMAHEFTHYVITHKTRNTVPIWLHEGIAKYLETRWRGRAGLALEPGSEALLAKASKNETLVTFDRMYPSIALLPSQEEAALAYAEVFTVIEWFDHKGGMAAVRAILDALTAGKTDKEAVSAAAGMPFDKWEALWRASLKLRPPPKVAPGFEKLVFQDDAKDDKKKEREKAYDRGSLGTIPQPEARMHAHLGELMRERSRLAAAATEYEKAIAIAGPQHPALARKYASTMLELKRPDDAEKVLRESLAAFPDDETNHLLYGQILLAKDRAVDAKPHFLIALQRDPFDAKIHEGLYAAAKALGDESVKARETDVLRILQGGKRTWRAPEPGNAVGRAYLRIETPSGARVLVDGVDTGLTTPVADLEVTSGRHVVRLEAEGKPAVEKTLEFAVDEVVPFPAS